MDKLTWYKSTRSNGSGACVEVAHDVAEDQATYIRDTKDRQGGTLRASRESWLAFTAFVRAERG